MGLQKFSVVVRRFDPHKGVAIGEEEILCQQGMGVVADRLGASATGTVFACAVSF